MGNADLIRLSPAHQQRLTETIAALVRGGVELTDAVEGAAATLSDASGTAAALIAKHVRMGVPLTSAVRRTLDRPDRYLIAACRLIDETGVAGDALRSAADDLRSRIEIRRSLLGALIYPAFVCIMVVAGSLALSLVVFPQMASLLGDTGMLAQADAEDLVSRGKRFSAVLLGLLSGLGISGIATAAANGRAHAGIRRRGSNLARLRLRVPVIGQLEANHDATTFLHAAGAALSVGATQDIGMLLASQSVRNWWIGRRLRIAAARVRTGLLPSNAVRGVFPRSSGIEETLRRVERGADPADSLRALASGLENERERLLTMVKGAAEPVAVIVAGALLLLCVVTLVQPLFRLYGTATL